MIASDYPVLEVIWTGAGSGGTAAEVDVAKGSSGDAVTIASYLGTGETFDRAVAVQSGRVAVQTGI